MSIYEGKVFFMSGTFMFFSDEQRDLALKFHGAQLASSWGNEVNIVVIGNDGFAPDDPRIAEKPKLNEMEFVQNLYFPAMRALEQPVTERGEDETSTDDDSELEALGTDDVVVSMDISSLSIVVGQVQGGQIYDMIHVYETNDDSTDPIIRSFFSYVKVGSRIVYACRGLTDNSSGTPHSQFGLLDVGENPYIAAFEEYAFSPITDQVYISLVTESGSGFLEPTYEEESVVLSLEEINALDKLEGHQLSISDIDDTDGQNYILERSFYNENFNESISYESKLFVNDIYRASEAVLQTGTGFVDATEQ
jgi:hypothetical protein